MKSATAGMDFKAGTATRKIRKKIKNENNNKKIYDESLARNDGEIATHFHEINAKYHG